MIGFEGGTVVKPSTTIADAVTFEFTVPLEIESGIVSAFSRPFPRFERFFTGTVIVLSTVVSSPRLVSLALLRKPGSDICVDSSFAGLCKGSMAKRRVGIVGYGGVGQYLYDVITNDPVASKKLEVSLFTASGIGASTFEWNRLTLRENATFFGSFAAFQLRSGG
jgi:hypothetical protein